MSSDPPKDDPGQPPNSKKLHIWGRPLDQPAPEKKDEGKKPDEAKPPLAGDDFQRNFPEAGGASLSDAVKNIKAGDLLEVHKSACGRSGLMMGIMAGAIVGGLRFVWRGTFLPFPLPLSLPLSLPTSPTPGPLPPPSTNHSPENTSPAAPD